MCACNELTVNRNICCRLRCGKRRVKRRGRESAIVVLLLHSARALETIDNVHTPDTTFSSERKPMHRLHVRCADATAGRRTHGRPNGVTIVRRVHRTHSAMHIHCLPTFPSRHEVGYGYTNQFVSPARWLAPRDSRRR